MLIRAAKSKHVTEFLEGEVGLPSTYPTHQHCIKLAADGYARAQIGFQHSPKSLYRHQSSRQTAVLSHIIISAQG
jgi:hypothetical protein